MIYHYLKVSVYKHAQLVKLTFKVKGYVLAMQGVIRVMSKDASHVQKVNFYILTKRYADAMINAKFVKDHWKLIAYNAKIKQTT